MTAENKPFLRERLETLQQHALAQKEQQQQLENKRSISTAKFDKKVDNHTHAQKMHRAKNQNNYNTELAQQTTR